MLHSLTICVAEWREAEPQEAHVAAPLLPVRHLYSLRIAQTTAQNRHGIA